MGEKNLKELTKYYIKRELELKINELEKQLEELNGLNNRQLEELKRYLEKQKDLDSLKNKCTFNSLKIYQSYLSCVPVYSHFKTFIFIIICVGKDNNGVPVFGMTEALCIEQATLSRVITSLKKFNLIQEIKSNDKDGRKKYLNLTEKGLELSKMMEVADG